MGAEPTADDLDDVIERYHLALGAFMRGDHEPARRLYSERDDVTLGNPFGPFAQGFARVVEAMARAAANYRDGEASAFDTVSKHVAGDLAYLVEVERLRSKVGGRDDLVPVELRVTTIFRREADGWRIVHRHADPITTARPADSVLRDDETA
jgi:ketosteroid isomerase-like protein